MKIKIENTNIEDEFSPRDDAWAYKDGLFHEIWRSSKSYCIGGCLGRISAIIVNGEIVKWTYPMFEAATHPYEYIELHKIMKWKKICWDFENRHNGYQLIDTTFVGASARPLL